MSPDELAPAFESYRRELRAFILRLTASASDADDIVQETYLKAHTHIGSFRGDSSLKTWVFAIATNLARDILKAKKRWPANVTDMTKAAALGNPAFFQEAMSIAQTSPQGQFEIKEHIAFCFTCVSKSLPLEHHLALLLKEVYAFTIEDIAEIMDQTSAMVKYYLHAARDTMISIFDARCSLINKQGPCHQCTELNGIFNPKQNHQEERMKIRMARDAADASKDRLLDLRLQIVQGIDPFESGAAALQLHHLEHNKKVMEKYLGDTD